MDFKVNLDTCHKFLCESKIIPGVANSPVLLSI